MTTPNIAITTGPDWTRIIFDTPWLEVWPSVEHSHGYTRVNVHVFDGSSGSLIDSTYQRTRYLYWCDTCCVHMELMHMLGDVLGDGAGLYAALEGTFGACACE